MLQTSHYPEAQQLAVVAFGIQSWVAAFHPGDLQVVSCQHLTPAAEPVARKAVSICQARGAEKQQQSRCNPVWREAAIADMKRVKVDKDVAEATDAANLGDIGLEKLEEILDTYIHARACTQRSK